MTREELTQLDYLQNKFKEEAKMAADRIFYDEYDNDEFDADIDTAEEFELRLDEDIVLWRGHSELKPFEPRHETFGDFPLEHIITKANMISVKMKQDLCTELNRMVRDDENKVHFALGSEKIDDEKYKEYTLEEIILVNRNLLLLFAKNEKNIFVPFDELSIRAQLFVYACVMPGVMFYDTNEFFEEIQGWFNDGCSLTAHCYDDNLLVYTAYNSDKSIAFEYYDYVGVMIRY